MSRLAAAARTILVLAILVFGGALAFSLFHLDRLTGPLTLVIYYVLPAVMLIVLGLVLRSSDEAWIKAALALVSTAVPLFALEAGVQWYTQAKTFGDVGPEAVYQTCTGRWADYPVCFAAAARGDEFDHREMVELLSDLAEEGITAWPNTYAALIDESRYLDVGGARIRPLAGVSRSDVALCNETGRWILFESDEHGFNNPRGLYGSKAQIVLVGDSFTEGRCIPVDRNFQAQIRGRYPRTVSLGFDGAGPLHELGALLEFGAPLRPDVVLWMFFEGNDLRDLAWEREDSILIRYLEPGFSQGLSALQDEVDQGLREGIEMWRDVEAQRAARLRMRRLEDHRNANVMSLRGLLTLRRIRRAVLDLLSSWSQPDEPYPGDLFRAILVRARDEVRAWGGRLVFVYVPGLGRLGGPGEKPPRRDLILRDVHELGIPVIDLVPVLEAQGDVTALFRYGLAPHYTEEGYALAGEALLKALEDQPVGPVR